MCRACLTVLATFLWHFEHNPVIRRGLIIPAGLRKFDITATFCTGEGCKP